MVCQIGACFFFAKKKDVLPHMLDMPVNLSVAGNPQRDRIPGASQPRTAIWHQSRKAAEHLMSAGARRTA